MDSERRYRCLLCQLVVDGKLAVHLHVRRSHPDELEDHHVDEFVEGLRVFPLHVPEDGENVQPPFICLHCGPGSTFTQLASLLDTETSPGSKFWNVGHLGKVHEITKPVYGHDWISQLDFELARQREIEMDELRLDRALVALDTFRGVADFLTECESADA